MAALIANLISLLGRSSYVKENKYPFQLPSVCHVVLGEDVIRGKAVFVVGDVHGCSDELQDLIQTAQNIEPEVVFIFVGDVINRGPDSMGVLRLLQSGDIQCYSVRGNHEEKVLKEYQLMKTDPNHVVNPKRYWVTQMSETDFKFMSNLPFTISIPSLRSVIVHAGLVPGVPVEQQNLEILTEVRNLVQEDYFDGNGLVVCRKPDRGVPWSSLWPGPEHVYYGHDARRGFQQTDFATCLDTGCQFGYKLTGIFINGCKKVVSVKAKRVYCKGKVL